MVSSASLDAVAQNPAAAKTTLVTLTSSVKR